MDGFNQLATSFKQNDAPRTRKLTALANATARFLASLKKEHGEAGDHYAPRFEMGILIASKPGGDIGSNFQAEYQHGLQFDSSSDIEIQIIVPASVPLSRPTGLVGCDNHGRLVQFYRYGRVIAIQTMPAATRVECVLFGVRNAQ